YPTFKAVAIAQVQRQLRGEFPQLVSSPRCVERLPTVLVPLIVYRSSRLGEWSGMSVSDAPALAVGKPPRRPPPRRFPRGAAPGTPAVGWYYGFTRHLVGNDRGELLACCLTPGPVDDRRPVPRLGKRRVGKLFGARGSSSQDVAKELLVEQGVPLITTVRKTM